MSASSFSEGDDANFLTGISSCLPWRPDNGDLACWIGIVSIQGRGKASDSLSEEEFKPDLLDWKELLSRFQKRRWRTIGHPYRTSRLLLSDPHAHCQRVR
jgi:hypothetical protein